MTLTLLGEPLRTNHIWKHSCLRGYLHSYMTKEGTLLKESYQEQAMKEWGACRPLLTAEVTVTLFFGNRRKRDIDNQLKLILDALTGIVWTDDKQIVDLRIVKAYDKEQPRAEIVIN